MKKIFICTASTVALLSGCIDSPLSDVEFTDFKVIQARFEINKSFGVTNASEDVTVFVRDKNGCGVKIKNGSITANGIELDYHDVAKYYSRPNSGLPVLKNSTYTFIVTLSNGDTCMSKITTPNAEFGEVTCPSRLNIMQDTTITWSDFTGQGNSIRFSLSVDSDADSVHLEKSIAERLIPDNGRFTITHDLFDPASHTGDGQLSMVRKTGGTASNKLRDGSEITADFRYSRSITFVKTPMVAITP